MAVNTVQLGGGVEGGARVVQVGRPGVLAYLREVLYRRKKELKDLQHEKLCNIPNFKLKRHQNKNIWRKNHFINIIAHKNLKKIDNNDKNVNALLKKGQLLFCFLSFPDIH